MSPEAQATGPDESSGPPSTPTVLLLTTTFDLSGAERVFVYLARGLAARGYRVIATCLQQGSGTVARALDGSGVQIESLDVRNRVNPAPWLRLVRLLRRERVDIVYTFMFHPHLVGRSAARAAGVPIVLSSQQVMAWEGPTRDALNRWTARWCSRVVAVSDSVATWLIDDVGIPAGKVATIFNCVDVDYFSPDAIGPARGTGPVIGSAARLAAEKDHTTLIAAFADVLKSQPAATLRLAGDGPERPALEAQVRRLGIEDRVEFLGRVEDIRAFYGEIDVYVQSSHAEGLPLSVLEAMACGLPVVATGVGGSTEAVVDGTTGHLVPPGDAAALSDRLATLVARPDAARAMGAKARERAVQLFSAATMVRNTDALLRELTQARDRDTIRS